MYNAAASTPTLVDCVFRDNMTDTGGSVYNDSSHPTFVRCLFDKNIGWSFGGAMYNASSNPLVTGCTFTRNLAGDGGAVSNYLSSPILTNCVFRGNIAARGAVLSNYNTSNPTLTNCTFAANMLDAPPFTITEEGGAIFNDSSCSATLRNCILWAHGVAWNHGTGPTTFTFSDVQGGAQGVGNIDRDPQLTSHGRLRVGSPCIDAGSNGAVPPDSTDLDGDGDSSEPTPLDIDGDPRFADDPSTPDTGSGTGHLVDMGADEFRDTDGDGLPDWWEEKYFATSNGAAPLADADGDGLTTLREYEEYSSNPVAAPYYVDGAHGDDNWNGLAMAFDPISSNGPKRTIQAALDLARDGDTVLVAAGMYGVQAESSCCSRQQTPGCDDWACEAAVVAISGSRCDPYFPWESPWGSYCVFLANQLCGGLCRSKDTNLDYDRKSVVVRRCDVPGICDDLQPAVIDCGSGGQAVDPEGILGTFAVLEGFMVTNGSVWSAGSYGGSRLMLKDCIVTNNTATNTGNMFVYLSSSTFDELTVAASAAPVGASGLIGYSNVHLRGNLYVAAGMLVWCP